LKKKNLLLLTDDVIYEDIVHEFYTDAINPKFRI